jgi:hypothetical protein
MPFFFFFSDCCFFVLRSFSHWLSLILTMCIDISHWTLFPCKSVFKGEFYPRFVIFGIRAAIGSMSIEWAAVDSGRWPRTRGGIL